MRQHQKIDQMRSDQKSARCQEQSKEARHGIRVESQGLHPCQCPKTESNRVGPWRQSTPARHDLANLDAARGHGAKWGRAEGIQPLTAHWIWALRCGTPRDSAATCMCRPTSPFFAAETAILLQENNQIALAEGKLSGGNNDALVAPDYDTVPRLLGSPLLPNPAVGDIHRPDTPPAG